MAKKKIVPLNPTTTDPTAPILLLNDVTGEQSFKEYACELNSRYNKDRIRDMASHIRNTFLTFSIRDRKNPACGIPAYDCVMKEGLNARKDYLNNFVALVMSDDENFATYIDHLQTEEQQFWDLVYRCVYINDAQAFAVTGRHWVEGRKRYSWSSSTYPEAVQPAMAFFGYSTYYNHWIPDVQPYIHVREDLWKRYARAVDRPRQQGLLQSMGMETEALPAHLLRYSNEAAIGTQMTTLRQMSDQGLLEFGAKKMSQTLTKRVAKTIALPELFPETKYKDEVSLEATVMIPALAQHFNDNRGNPIAAYWETLRHCINDLDWEMWVMEFLKHLRAVPRDEIIYDNIVQDIYNELIEVCAHLPVGRWFSSEEIEVRRRHLDDSKMESFVGVSTSVVELGKITHASTGQRVPMEETSKMFGRPIAQGFLVLFATFGLIDIAYHSAIEAGEESCWDCVDYISLTPLGAYVFGVTDTYQTNVVIHSPQEYFVVDAERLIIRAIDIDDMNPYENLLSRIAAPIGSRRYHVTPEVFMKGVTNEVDIDAKERFFRDTVSADVPSVWQEFFHEMRQRCFPLRPAGVGYRVLRVVNTDPAFLRILTTDAYIRDHTLRAEKALLLVETRNYEKVLDRIRSYGYLM